jgi:hypothetical protein
VGDVAVTTNEMGWYEVQVPAGFYDIFVSSPAFTPTAAKVRVREGQRTTFNTKLAADPLVTREIGDEFSSEQVIEQVPIRVFDHVEPTPENCAAAEHVEPNLHVPITLQLSGHVKDESGALFKSSRVELRRVVSDTRQEIIDVVTTDSQGNFTIGTVPQGDYRLLASPTRAFKQPEETWCRADKRCVIELTLKGNPTDLPESQCPIR